MQNNRLLQKLQHLLSQPHASIIPNQQQSLSPTSPNHLKQIKQQLSNFNEFISQQIIRLSAYYQTKMQYLAGDYQEEIGCLKKEIERQYKVIGLMKLELEELVVLVNQQRGQGVGVFGREREHDERMKEEEEYREWRVKQSTDTMIYTQMANGNKDRHQGQTPANPTQRTQQQHPAAYSRSNSTISGLQIIAEQQTERTLMSAGDDQEYPVEGDYFQNDEESGQKNGRRIDDKQSEVNQFDSREVEQQCGRQEQSERIAQSHMLIDEDCNDYMQNGTHQMSKIQSEPTQEQRPNNQPNSNPANQGFVHSQFQPSEASHTTPPVQPSIPHHFHKPQLRYIEEVQEQLISNPTDYRQTRNSQKTNFVNNPFAKKLTNHQTLPKQSHLNENLQEISFSQEKEQRQNHGQDFRQSSPSDNQLEHQIILKSHKKSAIQLNPHTYKQPTNPKPKSTNSQTIMSILELIATNNYQPHSKRSQPFNQPSSRSKSKSKPKKSKQKSSANNSNVKHKKSTNKKPQNIQTQQQHDIDSQNNSRFTMVRCPTSEDITSTQRLNPKSFDESQCFTSNDFRENSEFESCDHDLRSFHTNFGRPASSEYLKEAKSVNGNKEMSLENFYTNERKGSMKWKKQTPPMKENFGNKENQRQRRMSQKGPSSRPSGVVSKKSSTKYLKPNASFASEQSVHSMLQSHLENSNKFLVGTKKQQVKYDGERMTLGQQQMRHGSGTLYYSNGLIYEGEFYQNKRHGFGLLKFNHVELYSGEWEGDQLSGKGKIRNCAIINKKKKQQTQVLPSNMNTPHMNMFGKWISYCGQFMSNRFEGEGTLYLQGGEKFVGWFGNGVADGEGSLYRKNGEVENGVWRNNVLVERQILGNVGLTLSGVEMRF